MRFVENTQPTEISNNFIETEQIKKIKERAQLYLNAGLSVHLSGASGTGKTSLALYLAQELKQPFILIYGNEDLNSTDLLGSDFGFKNKRIIDNFVHSVHKTEEEFKRIWVDNRITTACKNGYTLIYDEFTRSSPESNNVLLSVLEEKLLQLPPIRGKENFLKVHENFKAIFTSNPEEYAGVHPSQDALLDRVITIKLNGYDHESEILILKQQSKLNYATAEIIISLIEKAREYKEFKGLPTLRAAIKLGRIIKSADISLTEPFFKDICIDILAHDRDTTTIVSRIVDNYLGDENND